MSVANVPRTLDGLTITTHVAQQTRHRNITRGDIKRTLEDGEVKPESGGEYRMEYTDTLTDETFILPIVNDGNEWILKTAYRQDSSTF